MVHQVITRELVKLWRLSRLKSRAGSNRSNLPSASLSRKAIVGMTRNSPGSTSGPEPEGAWAARAPPSAVWYAAAQRWMFVGRDPNAATRSMVPSIWPEPEDALKAWEPVGALYQAR